MNTNDKIAYQDGAIVSSEIIKQEGGTVTLFAFDKGQGLSEHTAPFNALVVVTDGKAKVTLQKQIHILKKDQMLLMPKGAKHSLEAIDRFKMILVMMK